MKIPKELRGEVQNLFFEGLIETEDVDSGHVLQKIKAMEWALGNTAIKRPDLYHQMMTLGPMLVMERIADGFFNTSRQRNVRRFQSFDDWTIEELVEAMDSEVVSWKVDGQKQHEYKFVYHCTLAELRRVVASYQSTIDANVARRDRYQALIDKLEAAGISEDTEIGDLRRDSEAS